MVDIGAVPSERARNAARPVWLDRACIIVPAYQAEKTLGGVIADLRSALPQLADEILVIDDGSTDATADVAIRAGCLVVSHGRNRGKGSFERPGRAAPLTAEV